MNPQDPRTLPITKRPPPDIVPIPVSSNTGGATTLPGPTRPESGGVTSSPGIDSTTSGLGVPAPSQIYSPSNPPGLQTRGTSLAVVVSVDNANNPRYCTIAVNNKFPYETNYLLQPGVGPFAAGGTPGFYFFYNNSSGIGGSIVNVDLDSRMVIGFTGDNSTSAPTAFLKAITDHKHSGNLNPDGFLNPNPVDLNNAETQNTLPYSQHALPIQAVISTNATILSTMFPGGQINGNGALTNVDGVSSRTAFPLIVGQAFTASADISKGSLTLPSGIIIGNLVAGYGAYFDASGNFNLSVWNNGTRTDLSTVNVGNDTSPHTIRVTVTPQSTYNLVEVSFGPNLISLHDTTLSMF